MKDTIKGVMKFYNAITESHCGRNCAIGLVSLQGGPKRSVCEVVKVKHNLQWKSHDIGDSRIMRHWPRKDVGMEQK